MNDDFNLEEYLSDLEKAIQNKDSFYWQEDMQFLIDNLRTANKQLEYMNEFFDTYKYDTKKNTVLIGHQEFLQCAGFVEPWYEDVKMKVIDKL